MKLISVFLIAIMVISVILIGFITNIAFEKTRKPDLITEGISVKKEIYRTGGHFIGKIYQPPRKEYRCYFYSIEMNETYSIEYSKSEWQSFKENEKYKLYFTNGKITGITHLVKVEKK